MNKAISFLLIVFMICFILYFLFHNVKVDEYIKSDQQNNYIEIFKK